MRPKTETMAERGLAAMIEIASAALIFVGMAGIAVSVAMILARSAGL